MRINTAKELIVYQKAYELAMQIFEVSKAFPVEEKYALTSQIRRSSRSVCLNLREAWAKRRYEAHFISKLTDCDDFRLRLRLARPEPTGRRVEPTARRVKTPMKPAWQKHLQCLFHGASSETDSSLDFAKDCDYINHEKHKELTKLCHEIGKMLGSMINNPKPFLTC